MWKNEANNTIFFIVSRNPTIQINELNLPIFKFLFKYKILQIKTPMRDTSDMRAPSLLIHI